MEMCYLCGNELPSEERDYLRIPDGTNPDRIYKMHVRCFTKQFSRTSIKCKFCGADIKIQHQFERDGLRERDYIPYHHDPAEIRPEMGAPNAPHRESFQINNEATEAICPESNRTVDRTTPYYGAYIPDVDPYGKKL